MILRVAAVCLSLVALAGCSGSQDDADDKVVSGPRPTSTLTAANIPACQSPAAATGETPERALPDVTLDCLVKGEPVKLSDLRGKPLMVNVWAQWCGPCRLEAPFLKQLSDSVAASGKIAVLGVDIADPQPQAAVEFASAQGWRYPQVKDPDKLLMEPLNLAGPPATAFVTADGEIRYVHLGPFTSYDDVKKLVRENLGVDL